MSDSDEDMRSVMRAERIAERTFNDNQQWPFEGGLSSSDDEWLQNASSQEQSMVKTEWNRLRREWVSKQPLGYHIWKLVDKDGPQARAEIKKIFAANTDLDINKLFCHHSWGENKGKPNKGELLVYIVKTLPMFKLFVELGLDLNNEDLMITIINRTLRDCRPIVKYILGKVKVDLNKLKTISSFQGGKKEMTIIMDYERFDNNILKLLIKHGANINAVDIESKTALMIMNEKRYNEWTKVWESKYKHRYYTKMYLENGADPNIQDKGGNTFLHYWRESISLKLNKHIYEGFPSGNVLYPKTIDELFFGETIDPVLKLYRGEVYEFFKYHANPFIKNKKGECAMDEPSYAKIYSKYMCDKMNVRQKLALACMLLPQNENFSQKEQDAGELPEEIIRKICDFLSLSKQVVNDIRGSGLYQRFIRQELENAIRESYPGFDTDHLIEHYQKELEKPGLPENTRKQYIKMLEKRLRKLGKEVLNSRFRSRTRRNSRASMTASTQNKSQRQSRSSPSEDLRDAIKQSLEEAKSGSKKKKRKTKKK